MIKEAGIYKLTSPSGKVYIGQSSNIRRRMVEHLNRSKTAVSKLYSSFKKHGFDAHKVEVLFLSDSQYERNRMEQFFINYYDSVKNGLNLIDVIGPTKSFTGRKHSPEEVERIKARMKGVAPVWAFEKNKKKIFCETLNETFESTRAAAKALGVSQALVSMMANGKHTNKYKVRFL
jgi:predicted MPP superfamily phosphohydrolase